MNAMAMVLATKNFINIISKQINSYWLGKLYWTKIANSLTLYVVKAS